MDVIPDYRKFAMEVIAKHKVPCFQENCCPTLHYLSNGQVKLTDDYGGSVTFTKQEFEALYKLFKESGPTPLEEEIKNNTPS